jgi:hypothetical protein
MPPHPERAPRRAFREQRRYFRRVHRLAAAWSPVIEPAAWWQAWHYHADWPGWGNRRHRWRREHLRALCRVFRTIVDARDRFATPFQAWIQLDHDDAGQDATFLHTPNPHATPFPLSFDHLRRAPSPSPRPTPPPSTSTGTATTIARRPTGGRSPGRAASACPCCLDRAPGGDDRGEDRRRTSRTPRCTRRRAGGTGAATSTSR